MVFTPSNFRLVGSVEATSFLLLLLVAMPLKYLAGFPLAVTVVGMAHGVIFLAYLVFAGLTAFRNRWSLVMVLASMLAAILPFGPFAFDRLFLKDANRT